MKLPVVQLALLLVLSLTAKINARSGGAPAEACGTLTQQHGSNTPQTSTIPYEIDLSVFDSGSGNLFYEPDATYSCESQLACKKHDILVVETLRQK